MSRFATIINHPKNTTTFHFAFLTFHLRNKSEAPRHLDTYSHKMLRLPSCVTCGNKISSTGISTCCPSPTPFGLGLGPTNPGTIIVAQETLGLRCPCFSQGFWLLMPTFSLPYTPPNFPVQLHCSMERSPTARHRRAQNNR